MGAVHQHAPDHSVKPWCGCCTTSARHLKLSAGNNASQVDNSEWTRNSDYAPTRFQAQADCVNLLAGAKTQANPENTVGVITMAGKAPQVLVTPTPDLGKVGLDSIFCRQGACLGPAALSAHDP